MCKGSGRQSNVILTHTTYWAIDYFIIGLELFGYDDLNQVYLFDESLAPYLFIITHEQPMQSFSYFRIQEVWHYIDDLSQLWFYHTEDSLWYPVLVHTNIADALSQILELFQPLHLVDDGVTLTAIPSDASHTIQGYLSMDFGQSTDLSHAEALNQHISNLPNTTTLSETNIPVHPSESDFTTALQSLPPLNTPTQAEIDSWLGHYQRLRKASKTREGLPKVACPLLGCSGQNFRRIHSLRDHLFSHFGIKPYECDVCQKRFGVKANCKRHMEAHTCSAA
ncbi:hypothetical protein FRC12_004486 [Ceratobasidium sp. 428]|nr:hypothetical protein FRC12_004486 [Ceratobasidium sp. 428]